MKLPEMLGKIKTGRQYLNNILIYDASLNDIIEPTFVVNGVSHLIGETSKLIGKVEYLYDNNLKFYWSDYNNSAKTGSFLFDGEIKEGRLLQCNIDVLNSEKVLTSFNKRKANVHLNSLIKNLFGRYALVKVNESDIGKVNTLNIENKNSIILVDGNAETVLTSLHSNKIPFKVTSSYYGFDIHYVFDGEKISY